MPTLPGDFVLQQQHGDNLCWIAVAASVADYHVGTAGAMQQCDLAQHLIASLPAGTTCCPPSGMPLLVPSACDKAGTVSDALRYVLHYASETGALAPYVDIESEITVHNPVGLALEYSNGVKHAISVVDTYTEETGEQVLVVLDPADLSKIYYDYGSSDLGGQQNITWRRTFFTKA
jgi:hypothetical protein